MKKLRILSSKIYFFLVMYYYEILWFIENLFNLYDMMEFIINVFLVFTIKVKLLSVVEKYNAVDEVLQPAAIKGV